MSFADLEILIESIAAVLACATGVLLAGRRSARTSTAARLASWMLLATALAKLGHASLAAGALGSGPTIGFLAGLTAVLARMVLGIGLLLAVIDHESASNENPFHFPRLGVLVSVGAALIIMASVLLGMPPLVAPSGGIPRPVAIPPTLLIAMALGIALFGRRTIDLALPRATLAAALSLALAAQVAWALAGPGATGLLATSQTMLALAFICLIAGLVHGPARFPAPRTSPPEIASRQSPGADAGPETSSTDHHISTRPMNTPTRYDILYETCTDAVCVTDAKGTIQSINQAFSRLTGYTSAEIVGHPLDLLESANRDSDSLRSIWATLAATGRWHDEVWNRRKDGSIYPTRLTMVALPAENPGEQTYLAIQTDLTLERQLLESERTLNKMLRLGLEPVSLDETLQAIAEQVVAAQWLDLQSANVAFFFSEAAPEMFVLRAGTGLPSEAQICCHIFAPGTCPCRELIDRPDETLIERETATGDHRALCAAIRGPEGLLGMLVVTVPGGHPTALFEHAFLVSLADVAGAIHGLKITQEKIDASMVAIETKNHDILLAQRAADEANRLKSEFLANTSHELRTPLNSILGYLQLVIDGLCESREEEVEFVGNALDSGRHLLDLINDVLDIAKIEAGKLILEQTALDVESVFKRVYSLCSVQAEQRGVRLLVPETPRGLQARGDEARLRQVLVNLIGNAIKFTEADGAVCLECALDADEAQVLLSVNDTGIGIPADKQDAIFDSFTQVDATTTRKYGGTGLGLTITRILVERMGGWIGVESAPGRGSAFTVSLPVWRDSAGATPVIPRRSGSRRHGAGSALIVEDDPQIASELAALLDEEGYSIRHTSDILEASEIIEQLEPTVATVDYGLPMAESSTLVTGLDLVASLSCHTPPLRSRFVFVTPNALVLRRRLAYLEVSRSGLATGGTSQDQILGRLTGGRDGARILVVGTDSGTPPEWIEWSSRRGIELDHATGTQEGLLRLREVPQPYDAILIESGPDHLAGRLVLEHLLFSGELSGAGLALAVDQVDADRPLTDRLVFPAFTRSQVRADRSAFIAALRGTGSAVTA